MRAIVRGTYHPNRDGSLRAHIIRKHCRVGAKIEIVPEPENPLDPQAVAVYLVVWRFFIRRRFQIGYLKESTAAHFTPGPTRGGRVVKFHAPPGDNSPQVTIKIHDKKG